MILLDPDLDSGPAPTANGAQRQAGLGLSRTELRIPSARALARFLAGAQEAVRLRGEVSVLLTTDAAIRRLNRRFRGKDKATDVLSFPAGTLHQNQEKIAGDVAISVETARRQAVQCGHPLEAEIRILMLHGLLHLSGYDHERDAGEMARRERALRARLGLKQGLIERLSFPTLAPGKSRKDGARGESRRRRTADPSTASAAADSAQDDRIRRARKTLGLKRARAAR
jgi:probable rRNA maturation factor